MEGNPDTPRGVDLPAALSAVTTALPKDVCHPCVVLRSHLLALLFILVSVLQPTGFWLFYRRGRVRITRKVDV